MPEGAHLLGSLQPFSAPLNSPAPSGQCPSSRQLSPDHACKLPAPLLWRSASDYCEQWDVLFNISVPDTTNKKAFFEGLIYSSWGMLAITA